MSNFRTSSSPQKQMPPTNSHSISSALSDPASAYLLSLCGLPVLETSYKCSPTTCGLLCLASFTEHVFKVHTCCSMNQYLILFCAGSYGNSVNFLRNGKLFSRCRRNSAWRFQFLCILTELACLFDYGRARGYEGLFYCGFAPHFPSDWWRRTSFHEWACWPSVYLHQRTST